MSRNFVDQLGLISSGDFLAELNEAERELLKLCRETGLKGTLAVTVTYKPKAGRQVEISADVKVTPPKPRRESALVFVDDDGRTHRNDPHQRRLDLGPRDETDFAAG